MQNPACVRGGSMETDTPACMCVCVCVCVCACVCTCGVESRMDLVCAQAQTSPARTHPHVVHARWNRLRAPNTRLQKVFLLRFPPQDHCLEGVFVRTDKNRVAAWRRHGWEPERIDSIEQGGEQAPGDYLLTHPLMYHYTSGESHPQKLV